MAHFQYSGQNNWNSIWQKHSVIILTTRLGKKKKKKEEKSNHFISGSCFHLPTPSAARFLLLPFFWTRGWRAAWFPLHSELATERENKRKREIKGDVESEKGRNNSQVIVIIIKNKFLIIVICCCADNKATSVYFLISSIHCAIIHNTHAICLTLETRNRWEEITLNLLCKVTHAESTI